MTRILLLILFTGFSGFSFAQTRILTPVPGSEFIRSSTFDKNTVVKDSTGKQYTMEEAQLMVASGDYSMRPVTQYIIYKVSEAQKQMALSRPVSPSRYFKIGDKLEFLEGRDIFGNVYGPDNLTGKIVVFHFWMTESALTKSSIAIINPLVKEYASNPDVVFLAVTKEDRLAIRKFLTTASFEFHLIEDGGEILDKYGVRSFPVNLIVDKQGLVHFHSIGSGASNLLHMRKAIEECLKK